MLRAHHEHRLGGAASVVAGAWVAGRCQSLGGGLRGAPPAAALAGYWGDVYPLMPDGYRSADCRPGGTLDDGLTDAPWLARTSS